MKTWKQITFLGIVVILAIAVEFVACDNGDNPSHTHDWGEWVVTKEPTVTEEGEETRTCKLDPSHIEKRSIPTLLLSRSINEIIEFINTQTGGNTVDDPIPLFVSINLGTMTEETSGWQLLLNAIEESGKYVSLDLSYCEMEGTEFIPDYTIETGKNKIVSITLPDTATNIVSTNPFNYAFRYFTSLKSFNAKNLELIGDWAFRNLTNLEHVTFSTRLAEIGWGAFSGCTGIKQIDLSMTQITSISGFPGCTSLEQITFPTSINEIYGGSFSECTSLTNISFPASVTITSNPFTGCISLALFTLTGSGLLSVTENGKALVRNGTEFISYPSATGNITLSEGITTIVESAFSGCTNLTELNLPSSVINIGENVFSGCTNLTNLSFPASANIIVRGSSKTFSGCFSIVSFTLTGSGSLSVAENGKALIKNNTELVVYPSATGNVTLSTGITTVGEWIFDGYNSLTHITIPEGVTTIGDRVFQSCFNLEQINLPESLNSIGSVVFWNCTSLRQITLPANITNIGSFTFARCTSLSPLICLAITPPTLGSQDVFFEIGSNLVIKVPAGSVESYKNTEGWSDYADRISAIE